MTPHTITPTSTAPTAPRESHPPSDVTCIILACSSSTDRCFGGGAAGFAPPVPVIVAVRLPWPSPPRASETEHVPEDRRDVIVERRRLRGDHGHRDLGAALDLERRAARRGPRVAARRVAIDQQPDLHFDLGARLEQLLDELIVPGDRFRRRPAVTAYSPTVLIWPFMNPYSSRRTVVGETCTSMPGLTRLPLAELM